MNAIGQPTVNGGDALFLLKQLPFHI